MHIKSERYGMGILVVLKRKKKKKTTFPSQGNMDFIISRRESTFPTNGIWE
jgi:hypothetical protein